MSALAPYRVLDLTTERGWMCGKILADLGADVVKIEPPGGDPGRRHGPFAGDAPDPERNLRWWFTNRGKRSAVLDLTTEGGLRILRDLAAGADVLVESFDPGHLDALGLGYASLAAVNPSLVYTSITPFGQTGVRARWQGPDIVLAATGGVMRTHGDPDRAPVRTSIPTYELHGAAEAAANTSIALYHAARTGRGQHVDVASQLAAIRALLGQTSYPKVHGREPKRTGGVAATGLPMIYPCADGHVTVMLAAAFGGRSLLADMAKHVDVPGWLAGFDWESADFVEMARSEEGPKFWGAVGDVVRAYCAPRTKRELYEHGLRDGFLVAPVNTIADVRSDEQLQARGFWQTLDGVVYPGAWAKLSATPLRANARAPRIGEHTSQVLRDTPQPRAARPIDDRSDVFDGLQVLDMSWVGVGPMTARYLADFGAAVVRLESQKKIDVLRALPPFAEGRPGLNRSQFWADFNAGKLGLGVDLTNPLGRGLVRRLAAWADVVLESFTPGTLQAWQLGYDDLRELNPSLVMLSTCMQGQTGPHASFRGFGQLIASLGGFYQYTGWPDRGPTPVGPYTDTVCQRFACAAVVAALDHRRRTGEGQHIDLSQYETGLQFLGTELLDYDVKGRSPTRMGNASPDACPHGAYPCAGEDRWVAVAVETDDQWQRLCDLAGWPYDPSLRTFAQRKAREPEVDDLVASWTRRLDAHDVAARLQPDVPAGVVHTFSELYDDPQVVHRGYFVTIDGHLEIGSAPYEGMQAVLSATPGRPRGPAPCLGEHTVEVLSKILGLSEDEIADLIAAEAVEITGGES